MATIRPSQVRARILREHTSLRETLDALGAAVPRLQAAEAGAVQGALDIARQLYRDLRDHIDLEDALLAPALREADAWGPVRSDELLKHHAAQRVELRELSERSHVGQDAKELADMLIALLAELRADMAHEERDLLSPEILRDDVTTVDGGEDG